MAASVSVAESLRSVLNNSPSLGNDEYSITHFSEVADHYYGMIPADQIYKKAKLSGPNVLNNYEIKSITQLFRLPNQQHDLCLLTRDEIRRHINEYDFLHIGLVQAYIVVDPTILQDRAIPYPPRILVCLREAKYPNLKDSILAVFEMSLFDSANFNWFPNFSSSLSDPANSNGLVITVEPCGFDLVEGFEDSQVFMFEYTMFYKLMKGSLEPRSQFENRVVEVNPQRTSVLVPKPF